MTRPRLWIDRLLSPGTAVLLAGAMGVFYATLRPFAFQMDAFSLAFMLERFQLSPSSVSDVPLNLLLFVPVGFGLASLAARLGVGRRHLWLVALLGGLLLTLGVELLQVVLPMRTPSVTDLAMNTLGSVLGSVVWLMWAWLMGRWSRPLIRIVDGLTPFWLVVPLLLVYGYGLMLLAERLVPATTFDMWYQEYPLLLGNEGVTPRWQDRRTWEGEISSVVVADVALTSAEIQQLFATADPVTLLGDHLQADYPLSDAADLADRSGHLVDLSWEGESGSAEGEGVVVGADGWLLSIPDVAPLTNALRASNQLTVRLHARTKDVAQEGPSRLFAISSHIFQGNVALAQESDALVIRMRSPLGGIYGRKAEMYVPQVFVDQKWQDIAVSFDGATLTAVIDEREVRADLIPAVALFRLPYEEGEKWWSFVINPFTEWLFRLASYGLLLIPFGLLLGTLPVHKWRWFWLVVMGVSAVVVAVLFEFVFVRDLGIDWRVVNLVTPVLLIGWSAWVMRRWLHPAIG